MDCKWNFRKLSTSHYASFCSAPARVISDPRRAAKCAPLLSWIFTRQQIKNRCGRALGEWSGGWPVSDALKLNNWIEFRTSGTVDTSGDSIFGVCWLFRLHKVARFYKIKMKFDFEGCEEKTIIRRVDAGRVQSLKLTFEIISALAGIELSTWRAQAGGRRLNW